MKLCVGGTYGADGWALSLERIIPFLREPLPPLWGCLPTLGGDSKGIHVESRWRVFFKIHSPQAEQREHKVRFDLRGWSDAKRLVGLVPPNEREPMLLAIQREEEQQILLALEAEEAKKSIPLGDAWLLEADRILSAGDALTLPPARNPTIPASLYIKPQDEEGIVSLRRIAPFNVITENHTTLHLTLVTEVQVEDPFTPEQRAMSLVYRSSDMSVSVGPKALVSLAAEFYRNVKIRQAFQREAREYSDKYSRAAFKEICAKVDPTLFKHIRDLEASYWQDSWE